MSTNIDDYSHTDVTLDDLQRSHTSSSGLVLWFYARHHHKGSRTDNPLIKKKASLPSYISAIIRYRSLTECHAAKRDSFHLGQLSDQATRSLATIRHGLFVRKYRATINTGTD